MSGTKYLYSYNGRQGYVVGATMCYRRDLWAALKFNSMKESEDTDFVKRVGIMIFPHGYNEGFTAILHQKNIKRLALGRKSGLKECKFKLIEDELDYIKVSFA